MKYFTKAATVAVGMALVSQAAQAAFTQNDLYVGFDSSSGTQDLILNVGLASSLFNSPTVVDLSGDFNPISFSSVFSGGTAGVNMSVVGAGTAFNNNAVYTSTLRAGGAGINPTLAGSDLSGLGYSTSQINGGASVISGITTLPGTAGTDVADTTKPFGSSGVIENATTGFYGKTGANPQSAIDGSGILYEDIWKGTVSGGFAYEGYFTFNGNTESLTFTSAAVPEPGIWALSGFGLLALSLRNKFRR